MNQIYIEGCGAVSPAGWGTAALCDVIKKGEAAGNTELPRPGWQEPFLIRAVPPPKPRPVFLTHARLRRTSPITHYAVAAALEALGNDAEKVTTGKLRLGIVLCVMSGCVNYSRRFYDETLRDPGTASPLVFPETVFNAPASHIAALLGTTAINYTLVGDPGTFLQGIALAADWLVEERVDACLVIGAEEHDWLTSDAFRLFFRRIILSDGAGALYLKAATNSPTFVQLSAVTDSYPFSQNQSRAQAAERMRAELPAFSDNHLLCDGLQSLPRLDRAEAKAWRDWRGPRLSLKKILGEGLMAAAAWQCVVAIDALRQSHYNAASISVVGCNQQAIGAHFARVVK